jgi:hypothetical protein
MHLIVTKNGMKFEFILCKVVINDMTCPFCVCCHVGVHLGTFVSSIRSSLLECFSMMFLT